MIFLEKVIQGISGDLDRWRYCVDDSTRALGFAIGAMFVETAFKARTHAIVKEMINNVKDALTYLMSKADWMSEYYLFESEFGKVATTTSMIGNI